MHSVPFQAGSRDSAKYFRGLLIPLLSYFPLPTYSNLWTLICVGPARFGVHVYNFEELGIEFFSVMHGPNWSQADLNQWRRKAGKKRRFDMPLFGFRDAIHPYKCPEPDCGSMDTSRVGRNDGDRIIHCNTCGYEGRAEWPSPQTTAVSRGGYDSSIHDSGVNDD